MKICSKCKVEKPLTEFSFRTDTKKLRNACKACEQKRTLAWTRANITDVKKTRRNWREANSERARLNEKSWREKNKPRVNLNKRRWYSRSSLSYKLSLRLRSRIRNALKAICKSDSTLALIGCSIEQLMTHLESRFQPNMTWENYGYRGWHVDHIKPCAKFDLRDPEQQKQCFHFSNLQPLWATDNLKKNDSYAGD